MSSLRFLLGGVTAVAVALPLVSLQSQFVASFFDYGHYVSRGGEITLKPYPVLRTAQGLRPLVAPGKFGAGQLLEGLDGASVSLRASSIRREGVEMLELEPGSVQALKNPTPSPAPRREDLGTFTFHGEIVDSKCFLGVMNPGAGRVHRECAVRCISGGVPPIFVIKDGSGTNRLLWLTSASGEPHSKAILDYIAEPVQLTGRLVRRANLLYFETDLDSLKRE